jgi:hypothetical protein
MFHKISQGDSQPFGVITFFELGIDRAGVLILPSSSYNLNNGQKLDWGWYIQDVEEPGEAES